MTTIKKYVMWSVLFSALIGLSGCGSSSSDVTTASDAATASDFSMTLDVEESTVSGDWEALSSASGSDSLSASVATQGNYGTFEVTGDTISYRKTTENNETDTGVLEIGDGADSVQVTVTVHSLFWKQMSEGTSHTAALKSDGTLWSWGMNNDGQLGNGTMEDSKEPVQESTKATDWISISSGGNHSAAIKSDGTIWSWGLNNRGQLGDGTRDNSMDPIQESMLAVDWDSVRCGNGYSVAKNKNGKTWRWGRKNTAPVADAQSVITDVNTPVLITLSGSDANGDPLTYSIVTGPSNGTLSAISGNKVTYTPDADYTGADSFTFKVNDGTVDSVPATVSITVNDVVVNIPPVADAQSVVTDENTPVLITLSGSDANGDPLTYSIVTGPSNGTLSTISGNQVTYTPDADYTGADSFTFKVNDGTEDSVPATVSITVNDVVVNIPPVADAQSVVTDENTPVLITLSGSDANGDPLTYSIVTGPSNGTLSAISETQVTYTPTADYTGADSFTFKVNDGMVDSAPGTVSITVNPAVVVNTPPVADAQSVVTDENVATAITLTGSDADSDPLTYSIVTGPSNGTLSTISGNQVTYTPDADYTGADSFTFKVNDGTEDSVPATVSITVDAANPSDVVLEQIGLEADSPDLVPSVVTGGQLGDIFPALTDINASYETAYQDYIDANPDLFSEPATQAEVQAMVDAVNAAQSTAASDAVLAQIGLEADNPDVVNSVVTVAQLNVILPALTNVTAGNETAYQDYIDENPDSFASPATPTEVQTMIDAVNAAELNNAPTASDFNLTLDVNESTAIGDWPTLSSADDTDSDPLTALVKTQGTYGTCVVTDDSLAYLKTIETNATDTCELEISDGTDTVQITVSINSLYWKETSAGGSYTAAIKSDGTLWSWGSNWYGSLGDGTTTNRSVPTQESTGATNWSSVSAGTYYTVAIKTDGTLWAWGYNSTGQLGDGTATQRLVPTQEDTAATDWSSVSAGHYHTVALKDNGTLWAWGWNSAGQLGDGTATQRLVPTQEDTAATDWSSVSAGTYHTVALKDNGTFWAWGSNSIGELGDGTTTNRYVPTQESTVATNWSSVSAGGAFTSAVKTDGTLWAWGSNSTGQLGDGTTTNRSVPTQEDTAATNWSSVSAGGSFIAAVKTDGTLWAWGRNTDVQLGDGTTTNRSVPTQESTAATDWSSVSAGNSHTVAIKTDGTLWAWGSNSYGELGDGTFTDRSVPRQGSIAATDWSSVSTGNSHTVAIKTDGTLWAWGDNHLGKLGDGTTTQRISPTQEITGATDWSSVSTAQDSTVAIKTDGTLWAWGVNTQGQIGDGTTIEKYVPTQEITGATDWSSVSSGRGHTVAVKTDGTLWAWGWNVVGELGDGTTTQRIVPTQEITGATDWSSVSAGIGHTVAVKIGGTLWSWGYNNFGQLGDGTTTSRYVPTQESTAATDWSSVSAGHYHTVALKDNGTLWAWGVNGGALGDGTTTNRYVPTQEITGATDWSSVSAGSAFTSAVKTDGTLWAWGDNDSGQLGDGTTIEKYVPTQESTAATDWSSVSAGQYHTVALKDNGTFWAWGYNASYQLGIWGVDVPTLSQPRQLEVSDKVLAQIGAEADTTTNSVVTIAQLSAIIWPALTGIDAANEAAYQDYIDANPDLFSSPATQAEVQEMIDTVNVEQSTGVDVSESNVTASLTSIKANGVATSTITVTVKNTYFDFVTDATVTLGQTGASTISAVSNNNDGTYTFTVSSTTADTVTYTATADSREVTATADVTFTALVYGGILDTTFGSKDTLDTTFGTDGIVRGFQPEYPAHDIILDSSDNIYVSAGPGYKYDNNGTLEFSLGGIAFSTLYGITLDSSGNIYTTGGFSFTYPNYDIVTTKYTSAGVFDSLLGGGWYSAGFYNIGYDLVSDSSGNMYVTGSQGYESYQDMVTLKYTSTGVLDTTFGSSGVVVYRGSNTASPSLNRGYGVIVDNLDNNYVTGVSTDDAGDVNMVILKYTSAGVFDATFGTGGIATYNSTSYDYGQEIVRDSSGNLYVVGGIRDTISSDDIAVWKYTSAGVLDTTFGTGGMAVYDNGGASDEGFGLVLDSLGSIYVAGHSNNGTDNDMVVLKYTSAGVLDTTFDSDGILVYHRIGNDEGEGIALDSMGNLIVAGTAIWKYTGTGIVVHDSAAGGDSEDAGYDTIVDSTGNTYVTGSSNNGTDNDMAIWKYTSAGILDSTFGTNGIIVHNSAAGGDSDDNGQGIMQDSAGNTYVAGSSDNGSDNDMVIWKYTSEGLLDSTFGSGGIVVHDSAAGGNSDDNGRGIMVDSSGNIYVTGTSVNSGGNNDTVIWKYTSTGLLDSTFGSDGIVAHDSAAGGSGADAGEKIIIDSSGNIYVTGHSNNGTNDDMVIWKYTSNGTLDTTFDSDGFVLHNSAALGNDNDAGQGIALDTSGNIYVTGSSINSTGNSDMVIWKYTSAGLLDSTFGSDGIIVHNSAAFGNDDDAGYGIELDSSGNIYVTGSSNNGTDTDMVIWKYTSAGLLDSTFGSDGIIVHNSAAGGDSHDVGYGILLDSSENIHVGGYSINDAGNSDMAIWKYK